MHYLIRPPCWCQSSFCCWEHWGKKKKSTGYLKSKLVRKPGLKSVWLQTPNSSHYANKFRGSSGWSQKSQKPLVLQESYQVMRTEFLKYSVILILVNFPLVVNPLMKEAVKVSKLTKWSLAGLKTRLFFPSQASASFSFFSLGKVSAIQFQTLPYPDSFHKAAILKYIHSEWFLSQVLCHLLIILVVICYLGCHPLERNSHPLQQGFSLY